MKLSEDRSASPRSLSEIIREFVKLQKGLLEALRLDLGPRDWIYLSNVPRRGHLTCFEESWQFSVHGAGIRFCSSSREVDANRYLDNNLELFDAGRIIDYLDSLGEPCVSWKGKTWELDHKIGPQVLRKMCAIGEIERMEGLSGEVYCLPKE